jgi:arginyl-tRNA synthetase
MILELKTAIKAAAKQLYGIDVEPEVDRPDEKFGDYSTNISIRLAKQLGKSPHEIAEQLRPEIEKIAIVSSTSEAGPFINIRLTDEALVRAVSSSVDLPKPLAGQEILVEFGDPNPFKEMHIGHLYSYVVGDSICRLLESQGAAVRRLSYHGDVGLHVAKAIYGLRELEKERKGPDKLSSGIPAIEREFFLGMAYSYGAGKYDNDETAKADIDTINEHVYKKDDPDINALHKEGCELSFSYFDKILNLLDIVNDRRYLESQTLLAGEELVQKNLGTVFKKSDGAIVYEGEKAGLHTRVFITSKGLPTYETKDLGLSELKANDYPDTARSIIITANEQSEYFKVMLAALSEIDEDLSKKTTHMSHGFLSLSSGKMSSRTGNVYPAMELLLEVKDAVHKQYPDSGVKKEVSFAAVKYAFLKHRLGTDIVLNIEESISLDGNSGPYLQYAHARASSILAKSGTDNYGEITDFEGGERSLARKISEYPEIIDKAASELMPHHVATYLYELAQVFNRFYEGNRVIDDPRQSARLGLVSAYAAVLKDGLRLLNIAAPEKM